ncbi:MAG: M48 family metalloprotease [Arenicella sp.]|nr:M48 family metalloprotease [Arenicella sp.]
MSAPQYQNPKPTEGINYSHEHPLKEFAQLLVGIGVLILLAILLINTFAGAIAQRIPFEYEQRMVGDLEFTQVTPSARQEYLQVFSEKVAAQMDLPAGMALTVHYDEDEMVNAFATLGGNIVFFKGLIDEVESEQELATVVAHEIAHIKYRHPIVAFGKGVTLITFASFVGGASGSNAGEWLIGGSANLTLLKYSRDQERAADQAAAEALQRLYGHIGGAQQLFDSFADIEAKDIDEAGGVEMFRSHPYSKDRWLELKDLARQKGWRTEGELTTLEIVY